MKRDVDDVWSGEIHEIFRHVGQKPYDKYDNGDKYDDGDNYDDGDTHDDGDKYDVKNLMMSSTGTD